MNTLKNSKMKILLYSLFTLLILASCTVDTVSQDELLQQELLSISEASMDSNKSGSYEDDDDSYEDENSDNESNESEEGNENESEDDNDPNEGSEDHNETGEENDTDGTDDNDSSSSSSDSDDSYDENNENSNSDSNYSDNDNSDNDSSDNDSTDEDSSSDSSQNTQGFSATVLSNIQTYVNTNHSGQTIIKMEQETSYIEVDLSNGIEIYFDNNGNFMRYDN